MANKFIDQLKDRIGQVIGGLVLAAVCYTANTINTQNVELAKLGIQVQNINVQMAIFATKDEVRIVREELRGVDKELKAHLDEFKRLRAERLAREAREANRK